jgi:hypothetical protein
MATARSKTDKPATIQSNMPLSKTISEEAGIHKGILSGDCDQGTFLTKGL